MNQNIYKLKNGKTKGDWQLPLTDILVERIKENENVGLRKLMFVPGTNSFWKEDLAGDLKPEQIWFTNGKLIVPVEDKLLNGLLQIHSFFNEHYELFNKEAEAKKELAALKAKDEVIILIKESDASKIIATAMAIFGSQAFGWDESTAELELRKFAEANPKKLSQELNSKTYESKFLAALAFNKGIVRYRPGKTSVIWNDTTEGEVLKLARGENGISKLGELLSRKTDESELLVQAIGEKLAEKEMNLPKEDSKESDKDAEIAALKAALKKANNVKEDISDDIQVLRELYTEKFDGKDVPARYKNDADWLNKKLNE